MDNKLQAILLRTPGLVPTGHAPNVSIAVRVCAKPARTQASACWLLPTVSSLSATLDRFRCEKLRTLWLPA